MTTVNPANPGFSAPAPSQRGPLRWFIAGILVIVAIISGGVAWNNGLRAYFVPRNFGVVMPGQLYRSGQISAHLIQRTLSAHGIQSIVCLSREGAKPADIAAEESAAAQLGIERHVYPLSGDGTGLIENYALAIAAIDNAVRHGKPVLVHCVAGAQRTGGVIAYYRLMVQHATAAQAYAELVRYGWDPHDNPHLLPYLNQHMGELARRLVQMGVIPAVPDPLPVLGPR